MVGFAYGADVEVGVDVEVVGVRLAVGVELDDGEGVAIDASLVVVIAYIPELPHKFKELLAYFQKPIVSQTLLIKVNVKLA